MLQNQQCCRGEVPADLLLGRSKSENLRNLCAMYLSGDICASDAIGSATKVRNMADIPETLENEVRFSFTALRKVIAKKIKARSDEKIAARIQELRFELETEALSL